MTETPNTVDRIEASANITMQVSGVVDGDKVTMEVPISRLDATKDVEINQLRQNSLKANGYSVTAIDFSGTLMFAGYRVSGPDGSGPVYIEELLFDSEGVPTPVSVTVSHDLAEDDTDTYQDVMATSDGYEVRNEENTERAFDFIAMDRKLTRGGRVVED